MQPQNVAMSSPTRRRSGAKFTAGAAKRKREIEEKEQRLQAVEDLWGSFVVFAISKADMAWKKHTAGYTFT